MKALSMVLLCTALYSCKILSKKEVFPPYGSKKMEGFVFIQGMFDRDTLSLAINDIAIFNDLLVEHDVVYGAIPSATLELQKDSIILFFNSNKEASFYSKLGEVILFNVTINGQVYSERFNISYGKYFLISYDRVKATVNRNPELSINFHQYKSPIIFE